MAISLDRIFSLDSKYYIDVHRLWLLDNNVQGVNMVGSYGPYGDQRPIEKAVEDFASKVPDGAEKVVGYQIRLSHPDRDGLVTIAQQGIAIMGTEKRQE
jgi:hypothetical protein